MWFVLLLRRNLNFSMKEKYLKALIKYLHNLLFRNPIVYTFFEVFNNYFSKDSWRDYPYVVNIF